MNLKTRASLFVTALVMAAAFVFTSVHVLSLKLDLMGTIAEQQFALTSRAAEDIDQKLALGEAMVKRVADDMTSVAGPLFADAQRLQALPARRPALHALFDTIYVLSREGRVLADHPPRPGRQGADRSDREYFRAVLTNRRPYISRPFLDLTNHEPSVMITAPVFDAHGELVAMLAARMNLLRPSLLGGVAAAKVGRSGHFMLLTREGEIVMHRDRGRIQRRYDEFGGKVAFIDRALYGQEGTGEGFDRSGGHFLYSARGLAAAPWILVAAFPADEAFAPATALQRKIIWSGVALAVLLPLAVWLLMRNLLRPLDWLRETIRAARDDPERRIRVTNRSSDEIGEVAREFARMTVRLRWRERRQRRVEKALRESEARFRALTELSSDWYWEQDAELRLTRVEGGNVERSAVRLADVIGRRTWELPLKDVSPEQMQTYRETLERREPFSGFVYCIDGPDGRPRWASVSGIPVFDEAGNFRGYRGTGQNITERKRAEVRLRKTARELEAIFDNASVGIAFTRDRRFVRCSAAFSEMFGYERGELEGRPGSTVWPNEADYAALGREAGPLLLAGKRYETERPARRKDGSLFWGHVLAKGVKANDPAKGTIWIVEDVTERKRAEERLFAEKERAKATLHAIGDAVIVVDVRGQIEYMNPIAETLTGCDLLRAAGTPLMRALNLVDERALARVADPVRRVLNGTALMLEREAAVLVRPDGARCSIEFSAAPIRDRAQQVDGVVIAFRDVTRQREMAEQVSWQASHDALTGLINRREFERRLELALEQVRRNAGEYVLLFLDLDQFKVVNDTCGHVAGDELLRQLTLTLASRVRQSDTLARLGGDEFGVLLGNCSIDAARRAAEALREAVADFHFVWQDKTFRIGVSVGGVAVNDPGKSLASVMSAADAACYVAKDSGRNCVHLVASDDGEIAERHGQMQWVSRIHQALEENRFRLWCQEIRPIGTRTAAGDHYEILLRMLDEDDHPVPPMAFIPAAERYHLMPSLDRWVVKAAFASFAQAYPAGGARRLETASINLSGASIGDPRFLQFVQEQFAAYRVDPRRICFEITETAAIANLARASGFMAELKAMGCRFSLDDFGSGMSSFAYLKNLPVDYLKIDGGFVRDMCHDPIDRAMVESIHKIGHVMGIATVAEFVESDEILASLAQIGVDYAQGYGVAIPRPLEERLRDPGTPAEPACGPRTPLLTLVRPPSEPERAVA